MILVFTGNGKGKTTAALGQALRAVGEGKKVLMIQFIKGPWKSGEDNVEIVLKGNPSASSGLSAFKLMKMGLGFVGILGDTLPLEEHKKAAKEALAAARVETEKAVWDILILDEINNAVQLSILKLQEVLDFINEYPKERHLILTGRDAHAEVMALADLVSEVNDLKHPYHEGAKAKRGIEY